METGRFYANDCIFIREFFGCSTNTFYTRPTVDRQKYNWVQRAHYPTTKKMLLKSRLHKLQNHRSTGNLSVDLNPNRICPDQPESVHTDPAVSSNRAESVHTDPAHN
jgi:hypothetical protein